jgi:hypothetical protein
MNLLLIEAADVRIESVEDSQYGSRIVELDICA